jgi:hypothetical protein
MPPDYPLPWTVLAGLVLAGLSGRKRSFSQDARSCIDLLRPPLQVYGTEYLSPTGPCLVTINHYARPGFGAWWLALAVGAVVPAEMRWIVTDAWTYPDPLRSHLFTPLTRWAFRRLAVVYDFISMPPMPPRPQDVSARSQSVRQVLNYARKADCPVIGLAPEGRDTPGGQLGQPPPGVGRFIQHLAERGLRILPVGAYEEDSCFCLRFGPLYNLLSPDNLTADGRDRFVAQTVMSHIARLIPSHLQGDSAYNNS